MASVAVGVLTARGKFARLGDAGAGRVVASTFEGSSLPINGFLAIRARLCAGLSVAFKDRDRVAVTAPRSAVAVIDNAEGVPAWLRADGWGCEQRADCKAGDEQCAERRIGDKRRVDSQAIDGRCAGCRIEDRRREDSEDSSERRTDSRGGDERPTSSKVGNERRTSS
ncbi:hypothetical protein [Amycolatopsis sp. VC5-11]|uniref:hypothetical protein n=1 Tax=Amycolatopsis sp. VC5-11 TaxID=3120156 RepID=UPI00300BDC04